MQHVVGVQLPIVIDTSQKEERTIGCELLDCVLATLFLLLALTHALRLRRLVLLFHAYAAPVTSENLDCVPSVRRVFSEV